MVVGEIWITVQGSVPAYVFWHQIDVFQISKAGVSVGFPLTLCCARSVTDSVDRCPSDQVLWDWADLL